jgi:hypothetical protein
LSAYAEEDGEEEGVNKTGEKNEEVKGNKNANKNQPSLINPLLLVNLI